MKCGENASIIRKAHGLNSEKQASFNVICSGMGLIAVLAVIDRNQPAMLQQTITGLKHMKAKDIISFLGLRIKEYFLPEQRPMSKVIVSTLQQGTVPC